ncbi:hypothetical protein FHR50_003104 [Xanthomonas arboricola]
MRGGSPSAGPIRRMRGVSIWVTAAASMPINSTIAASTNSTPFFIVIPVPAIRTVARTPAPDFTVPALPPLAF